MNNIYVVPIDNINEVYEAIDSFESKIDKFKKYQPDYKYDIQILKSSIENFKWELRIKIWNDESKKEIPLNKVENPFGVL